MPPRYRRKGCLAATTVRVAVVSHARCSTKNPKLVGIENPQHQTEPCCRAAAFIWAVTWRIEPCRCDITFGSGNHTAPSSSRSRVPHHTGILNQSHMMSGNQALWPGNSKSTTWLSKEMITLSVRLEVVWTKVASPQHPPSLSIPV